MSLIYLLALIAVAAVVCAVMADTLISVSRRPSWHVARAALRVVEKADRRTQSLPFVGADRRRSAECPAEEARRAA